MKEYDELVVQESTDDPGDPALTFQGTGGRPILAFSHSSWYLHTEESDGDAYNLGHLGGADDQAEAVKAARLYLASDGGRFVGH